MTDTSAVDTDPIVTRLLAQFGTPPPPPNLAPFQKAKLGIGQQQAQLAPPQAPQLQEIPQAVPKAQFTDAFQGAGLSMMLLAGLAGALTGQPLASAFNNGAQFMNGLQKGDLQANKQKLDEFSADVDAAKAANQTALDQYHAAFESYNGDVAKLKSELSSIADAEGDTVMSYKLKQDQFDDAFKIVDARQKLNEQLSNHQLALLRAAGSSLGTPQMVETKDGKQILAQQDKAGLITGKPGQWVTADENHTPIEDVSGAVSATTAGLPQSNSDMAKMIASYQTAPLTGYALRSASGQQIMSDVSKINPQYNANNYDRIRKTIDDFAAGPTSKRIVSLNVAIQHLDTLQNLADALQSGNVQLINQWKQKFQLEFGEPAPARFDAVVQIVGKEVVKAIVNGGGGVTERNEAQNAFSRVGSPAQVSGSIDAVKQILAGQLSGIEKQYDTQTEGVPGVIPFQNFLLPDTQQQLGAAAKAAQSGEGSPSSSRNTTSQW